MNLIVLFVLRSISFKENLTKEVQRDNFVMFRSEYDLFNNADERCTCS